MVLPQQRSKSLSARAEKLFPGGVNSPVRAFGAVGGEPPMIVRAKGASLWDADGNEYIDYVGSWGPMILGHADPEVVDAVTRAAEDGTSFGASTPSEVELAELVTQAFPSIEMMRFVSSGTEATMSAIRLARGFTKRKYIVKFEGCYHGHTDSLLVKAGSGVATLGIPGSAGVLDELAQFTLALPFNSVEAVEWAFTRHKDQIAGIIVEPVAGNMGCVTPRPDYLQRLRQIADVNGPFSGRWEYDIAETNGGGSTVKITEYGTVRNPFFRFMSKYVIGQTGEIDKYLNALAKALKEEPKIS